MMNRHFLEDRVEGEPGFEAGLWYNPYGGYFECTMRNEGIIAAPVGEVLTLYRSAVDDRVIGFQIRAGRPIVAAV